MFCPNCGANNSTEQKFCRSCGLNLEKTAESVLEQLPTAQIANVLKHEKLIEKFGNFVFGGFCVVVLVAITAGLWYIVTNVLIGKTNVFTAVLLIAFIVFAFLTLVYLVLNEALKEKKQKINPALDNELSGRKDTSKLLEEKHFEPVRSVTKNSTGLIFVENKTTKIK
jgi:hypothetical protein